MSPVKIRLSGTPEEVVQIAATIRRALPIQEESPDQPDQDARGLVHRHLVVAERAGWMLMSPEDHMRLSVIVTLVLLLIPLGLYWVVGPLPILWVQAGVAIFIVFPTLAFLLPWIMRREVERRQK